MPARRKIIEDAQHQRFGGYLRSVREGLGVSQRELARRLDLPHSFVQKIEYGERQLQVLELLEICRALKIQVSDVLAGYERLR